MQNSQEKGKDPEILYVLSMDFDGCADDFFYDSIKNDVPFNEEKIIRFIQEKLATFGNKEIQARFIPFTSRYTLPMELLNALRNGNGLSFLLFPLFAYIAKFEFDNFLLTDIYHPNFPKWESQEKGVLKLYEYHSNNFSEKACENDCQRSIQIIKKLSMFFPDPQKIRGDEKFLNRISEIFNIDETSFNCYVASMAGFDPGKLPMFITQIHKIACENPDKQIVFDFYDDREDILNYLHTYFSEHPELIPKNVTVNFYQYCNPRVFNSRTGFYEPISEQPIHQFKYMLWGKGEANPNYAIAAKNYGILRQMYRLGGDELFSFEPEYWVLPYEIPLEAFSLPPVHSKPTSEGVKAAQSMYVEGEFQNENGEEELQEEAVKVETDTGLSFSYKPFNLNNTDDPMSTLFENTDHSEASKDKIPSSTGISQSFFSSPDINTLGNSFEEEKIDPKDSQEATQEEEVQDLYDSFYNSNPKYFKPFR